MKGLRSKMEIVEVKIREEKNINHWGTHMIWNNKMVLTFRRLMEKDERCCPSVERGGSTN